jgi:hypothetical protein
MAKQSAMVTWVLENIGDANDLRGPYRMSLVVGGVAHPTGPLMHVDNMEEAAEVFADYVTEALTTKDERDDMNQLLS